MVKWCLEWLHEASAACVSWTSYPTDDSLRPASEQIVFFSFFHFHLLIWFFSSVTELCIGCWRTHAKTELNLVRMVNWQNICSEYVNWDPLLNLGDRLFLFVRMERASRISMFTENCILKSRSLYHIQPTAISHSKQNTEWEWFLKEVSVAIGSLFIVISILYE